MNLELAFSVYDNQESKAEKEGGPEVSPCLGTDPTSSNVFSTFITKAAKSFLVLAGKVRIFKVAAAYLGRLGLAASPHLIVSELVFL